jgi:hypothetical protein
MVVDSVSDVLELRPDQIKPAPEFNGSVDATYITGLGTVKTGDDERMLILMDIEAMMASADMGLTDHAVASTRVRGQDSTGSLDALVACGIGMGTQISGAYNRARSGGLTGQAVSLGGKTNLVEAQDGRIGWAVAYGASLDKAPSAGWKHGGTRVFGVATRSFTDSLIGHFNLGWLRTESDRLNSTTWSLGVEGDGPVRWAADVFGDDRSRAWVSAGLVWPLAEKLTANLAYAQHCSITSAPGGGTKRNRSAGSGQHWLHEAAELQQRPLAEVVDDLHRRQVLAAEAHAQLRERPSLVPAWPAPSPARPAEAAPQLEVLVPAPAGQQRRRRATQRLVELARTGLVQVGVVDPHLLPSATISCSNGLV